MFRGAHTLTGSCPIRPLLILRESHICALSEQTGAARDFKQRRYERTGESKESLSSSPETVPPSTQPSLWNQDCENHQLRKASYQSLLSKTVFSSPHHPSHVSSSVKAKSVFAFLKCTFSEDLDQSIESYSDFLVNTTCLKPLERPWDIYQPLNFTSKTLCNLPRSNLFYRQQIVRPFSSLTHTPCIINHSQASMHTSSLNFYQIRALQQSVPHIADTLKYCLTLENERRCRQSLGPNLNLYDMDKINKRLNQSQGKSQARVASVLVSLCSVEGEPSFLFTLRSSTLKGRHKGDVSFAGGKCDPSDRDVVATALREAREELGVNVPTENVWGTLKPLTDRTGMIIAPVLANLGPLENLSFKPNPGEVEEIFTMSLSHLCNPKNRGYTHFRTGEKYGYTLPVFRNGKHRVWGLTAVALDQTLKLIVPPKQPVHSEMTSEVQ